MTPELTQNTSTPQTQSSLSPSSAALPRAAGAKRRGAARRALGMAACGAGLAAGILLVHLSEPHRLPLFLFCAVLAALAAGLPVTGPHGQRVGLLPAAGLVSVLLLPPLAALLPLLLANTVYALFRDLPLARRMTYERGVCLLGAALVGGGLRWLLPASPGGAALVAAAYSAAFLLARYLSLDWHRGSERPARRHAVQNWRLEAAGLLASVPTVLLMALALHRIGLLGLAGGTALLAALAVVAHFGFETAGLREQVRAMEKLSAVSVTQTSAPRVTEQFLALSRALVSCDRAVLWLTDDSQTRLERAGPDGTVSVRFGEGLAGRAAERKKPLLVRDGAQDPRCAAEEQRGTPAPVALLLLPLVASSQTVGVVQMERGAPGAFTGRDLARLSALAGQAAATLANVRAHQDVYSMAVTDALTGLYNRRHMQTVLTDERRRAERYSHPLSVIMLDVDGFKSYNDTYGHVQGDVLLKMLAGILQSSVRGVDIVGRFGGEEFIVVLPETPPDEAYRAAERLRLAVARTVFPGFADDPELAVFKTISLGVATFPDITQDTQALVTLADNALYRAKRGGRNQTVQADPAALTSETAV